MKKKNITETNINFDSKEIKRKASINDDYKLIRSFFIVVLIIGILALSLFVFNNKYISKDKNNTTTTEPTINIKKLSIAEVFKVKESNYYVLLYSSKDNLAFIYTGLIADYSNKDIALYSVDMNDALNSKYYNESGKENTKPTKYEDIMITKATLLEIKKGKVVSYITDRDTIINRLTK